MIGTHGNPGRLVVHMFPLLREDMDVSVALKGTSRKGTTTHQRPTCCTPFWAKPVWEKGCTTGAGHAY